MLKLKEWSGKIICMMGFVTVADHNRAKFELNIRLEQEKASHEETRKFNTDPILRAIRDKNMVQIKKTPVDDYWTFGNYSPPMDAVYIEIAARVDISSFLRLGTEKDVEFLIQVLAQDIRYKFESKLIPTGHN